MKYLIIIEKTTHNYSAYVPDVPGCVATGNTKDEARQNVVDALELHLEGLMEDGLPIPAPKSEADYIVAH
jgi:predicted RNase H-like HicB family nuclease